MKNVLEFLEASADRFPDKTVIADDKTELTYHQLLIMSKQIGTGLGKRLLTFFKGDIRRNSPIAVLLDKSTVSLASFMGVVYSGNFYVVLDAEMPAARMRTILETLCARVILTDAAHQAQAEELYREQKSGHLILTLEELFADTKTDEAFLSEIRSAMIDTDPVYALFTSGSTGVPKGTVIHHRNVISYISWYTETFDINEHTVTGSQTPFYFSMSVSDIYSILKCGGTLHIIPKTLFSFPIRLMEFLNDRAINTIYWVPSALCMIANWDMFRYVKLPYLKKVLFAGEVMPTKQLNYWRKNLPDAVFANLFGPTESTDICTYYIVDRIFRDDEPLPMGRACNNCQVFVLDEQGRRVSEKDCDQSGYSREGELYIRGSFVAMGYYRNREKTEEAFVQNPLNPDYPEPVYRTGDLVKYNQYGELVYVTRKDFQIKHMGYRIELGEIEAAAGALEGVHACACIYDGDKDKLVLVYEGRKLTEQELVSGISSKVPHYMVPNQYVHIKNMPHNQNGKIDRKWLQNHYSTFK